MSILAALNSYYDRLQGIAEPGWGPVKFGYCIVLADDGRPIHVIDLHDRDGKKVRPREIIVPAVQRTSGIKPALFWDKTAYALGCTAGAGSRTAQEHAAFKQANLQAIAGSDDPGLKAFRGFLETWTPDQFQPPLFMQDMLDANILFRWHQDNAFLHERPAARALIVVDEGSGEAPEGLCLVTGERAPLATLHPSIKGVDNAQSSGASLVSFNQPAFTSYGKDQGANAPTSASAAFRYGAALNRLLQRGGGNRLGRSVGDATVVFWADASDAEAAEAAESFFADGLDGVTDEAEAIKLGRDLEAVGQGRPLTELGRGIEEGTTFHVLGLSPNAGRLSVRFWLTDSLEAFAKRLACHAADLAIEPSPWRTYPSVNRLLAQTVAMQGDSENIPPLLAGEVMRAILSGTRYPQSWLAAAIMRLRAGDDPLSGWHAAAIRAVLHRDFRLNLSPKDAPMSLSPDEPSTAYQLGRLFAVLEAAQRQALGNINATIRDRYFGAASATPAGVFPLLLRGAQNHLGKLRKDGKGGWIEREIETVIDRLGPDLPRSLPLAEQGRFAIGYYHQRKAQFAGKPAEETIEEGDEQ
jgi:CRISPR-associated protein Csd1